MVVGWNLARGKIFTASIGSSDSFYLPVFIFCMNLHQFLILCSSKARMFVKLYLRTKIDAIHLKGVNISRVLHQSPSISALPEHPVFGMSQWRS